MQCPGGRSAVVIHRTAPDTETSDSGQTLVEFTLVIPMVLLLFMAASFEELGWRGYAYDSLQAALPQRRTDLLFGVLWSLWHLPLILVKDSYQYILVQENP